MAKDFLPEETRVPCPECGQLLPLNKDGKLPFHGELGGHCLRSETKPSERHCLDCGMLFSHAPGCRSKSHD